MEVGVKFEGNIFEEVSSGFARTEGKANGNVGSLVVVIGLMEKAIHQPVEPWSSRAKGGVEVVGNAIADLGGDDGWKH